METKKTKRADLESQKGLFLQIGFVIVLSFVLWAFEWEAPYKVSNFYTPPTGNDVDYEKSIITRPKEITPPPLPPKGVIEEIHVVKNTEDPTEIYKARDVEGGNIPIPTIGFPEEIVQDNQVEWLVSTMPSFQGGDKDAFWKYIQLNVKYPQIAIDNQLSGTVYIYFVVNKKGEVCNVRVERGVHPSIDKEAARAIGASPLWTPGKNNGKPANVAFIIPVKFELSKN